MGPAVFHGKTFFPGPEGSAVRVLAIAVKGSVIPAYFGHHVGVGTVVSEPGAIEGAGEGVVFAVAIIVPGICDAPFEEETVDALPIGSVVIAQLEAVVLAVYPAATVGAVGIPGPEAGDVFLPVPEPEVPHPLAEGVHGVAIKGVGIVGTVEEGLRTFIDGPLQLGEVPFRIQRIGITHDVSDVAAVPDGRRHIPEPPSSRVMPVKVAFPLSSVMRSSCFSPVTSLPVRKLSSWTWILPEAPAAAEVI